MIGRVTAQQAPTRPRHLVVGRLAGACVLMAVAWVGSGLRSHTWPPTIMVAAAALATAVLAFRRPTGRRERGVRTGLRRSVVAWSVLIGVGLLWEAYAFFHQPAPTVSSYAYPTLSTLADPLLEFRGVRFAGWLIWFGAGIRLARP